MCSILDQYEIIDETDEQITYRDAEGTVTIEFLGDSPLVELEEDISEDQRIDPENPQLVAFRSLLFDQVFHQLDIREWVC